MIPYSEDEATRRLLLYGTVFTLTRWKDGKVEAFILDYEEVELKELQGDKPKL